MAGIIPVLSGLMLMAAPLVSVAQTSVISHSYSVLEDSAGPAGPVYCLDGIQPRGNIASRASQIGVNAGQPVRMADARWFGIGTPIWDNDLDTPQSVTLLSKMGTQALRFPGGSVADAFHWYNNRNLVWDSPYGTTLAGFIQVVTNLNAEAMITVNYGMGSANEAAAWVAYVNATTNNPQYLGMDSTGYDWQTAGHWASLRASAPLATDDGTNFLRISRAAPLGFKYWEIGNENYGWWEADVNYRAHDPYTYAVRSQAYMSLMKAVDPTIKIGVVASPGVSNYVNNTYHPALDPVTQQTYNGWTPVVLATLASLNVRPDFAIMHCYPEVPGFENDAQLLSGAATGWAAFAADLRGQINDFLGSKGANVELICTEYNADVANPGKQSVSLVNGLFKADALGRLMQTEFNGLFWHDFCDAAIEMTGNMDPALYGWRLYGDFGVATTNMDVYPTFYTSELVPHFAQRGDMVVAANSDNSLLSVYAVRRQNGSLTVLAVNKDPLNTNTAQVSVAGFAPASAMAVYSYGIPQDTAAETGVGSPDIFQTNISVPGTSFSYAFPPYSATVLALSPAPSSSPSTTTVTASQNPALAGSNVTFTATVSGNGGIPTGYVVFKDGAINLGIGTLNSSGMTGLTTAALSAGGSPHSITAVYGGDGYFAGSTNSALSETITNKASVTTNGLLARWLFDEGSGTTVADSSGNGNTGTLNDSPVWAAGLNGSNALKFPGALVPGAAYVSAPDSATLADQGIGSNLTICAWVKRSPASTGKYSAVVSKDTPFDTFPYHRNYELIFDTDNCLSFGYRNSVGTSWEFYSSSNGYADTSNWHYYCVTYTYGSAASCTLYVDGFAVPGSWTAGNGSDAPASTSGGPVLIGIDGLGTPSYGSLYEGISIYSSNLLGSQVYALYKIGLSNGAPSTTALASSRNPAPAGSNVTFTATVSGSGGTPTGTVVFFDGNNLLGIESLNNLGVASLSTAALSDTGSQHSIVAVYDGDGTFGASSSGVLSQVLIFAPSTTTISSSQNPAAAGSAVTFTATVSGSGGTPTGTVAFYDGTGSLGSGTLDSSGVASLSTSALSSGGSPHSITAVYGGDGTFGGSTSGVLAQVITNSSTSTSLGGLSASWPFNEGAGTAVADSSGNGNTGALEDSPLWVAGLAGRAALEFPGASTPGAGYVIVPNSATLADQGIGSNLTICAWVKRSSDSVGNYCSVVAKDILNDSSPYHRNYEMIFDTGSHLLFVYRNSAGTNWEMYASSAAYTDTANWHFYCVTYTYGSASSCTLYVDGAAVSGRWVAGNGSDAPASTSGGPVLIGTDGTGTASHGSIYEGISIYNGILSASQVLGLFDSGIAPGVASTTAVVSSQNPAAAGSAVTFTATVSGSGGTPTGTVVFYDGTGSLGSGTLDSSGVASLSTSALSAGGSPHSITAVYGGDGTFGGSTSGVLAQVITNSSTSTSLAGLSASWPFNEGAGTAVADSSGNGNTGALEDSPLWVAGLAGRAALEFPGASTPGAAYVIVPNSATLADQGIGSNLTICAWVKRSPDSVGNFCSVVAKDILNDSSPFHRNYEMIFDTGSHLLFVYRNSAGTNWEMYASSAAYADTANWHFYCVTYTYGSAASCALYVDGAAVSGRWVAGNGSDAPASTSGGPVLIGTDGTGTASHGSICEGISIYNGILSASQVLELFDSGIAPGVASTTAVVSSQNPAAAESAVTFTATVGGSGGTPTGTVVFYDGTGSLGSGTLDNSGVASLSTSALSAGGSPHSITAVYGGDGTFGGSTSSVLSQIITNSSTSTSLGGLSASWPFNEGAGTAVADSSGNGNTGALEDSPLWVAGLAGRAALEFPGASTPGAAYVIVPNSATLADQGIGSNLTICAWVKRSPDSVGNFCSVVAKDVLNDSSPFHRNYEMIFDTGSHLLFVYRNSAGTNWEMYASSAAYTDTANWHFYCVTYTYGSASSCTLYVDGAAVSGRWTTGNGSDAPASTLGGPVLIGTDGTGTASHGSIYEGISIYNGILSASQVLELFDSGIAPGVASTTAVESSQNPAAAGSAVTFTATVGGSGGTPTGTVVFYDGTGSLGSGTLDSSGVASLSTSALSAGGSPHSITAVYGGDGTFGGSTSGVLAQSITGSSDEVSIPLVNASFEVPSAAQGPVAGAPAGWLQSNQDPCGVYNPAAGLYKSEVNDVLPSPAQGSQVLYIQGGNYVAQFLTNTLAANQTYVLSGAIGNRGDGYGLLGSDTEYVCLLAGGTILAQNANLPHPAPGTFLSWAVTYTTGAAGFPSGTLEIRLGQSGAGQVNYDNIALTSTGSAGGAAAALLVGVPTTTPQIMTGDASFGFLTGQFGFNVGGVFGQTVVVDGSTNLVDWTPLFTNSAGGIPFWFRDPASDNSALRFYRTRLQ